MTTRSAAVPDWAVGVVLGAALLLCYSSILVTPYAVTDDYVHLSSAISGGAFSFMISIARGCFTSAYASWAAFHTAASLAGLRWVRVVGVLGIALIAYILYRALRRSGWPAGRAAALGFLVCLTPPFQVCASWSVSFTIFYSCALTGLACQQALVAADPCSRRQLALRMAAATGLLYLAVSIYQVTLMYFIVFAVIDLFRPHQDPPRFWRRIAVLAAPLAAALVLGFASYKLGIAIAGTKDLGAARSQLVSEIADKAWYFVTGPFANALQLWKLWPTDYLPLVIGLAILMGLFLYFRGSVLRRLGYLGLALVSIPAIYLPNLLTAENWGAYRTQIGMTSLLVVYAFFALHGYVRALGRAAEGAVPPLLWAAALLAGVFAARNVAWYYADAQMTEIRVMKAELSHVGPDTEAVRVFSATWDQAVTGERYDEFGLPSSSQWWATRPMAYVLLSERGHRPSLPIVSVDPANPKLGWDGGRQIEIARRPAEHEVVVDMANLRFFAW